MRTTMLAAPLACLLLTASNPSVANEALVFHLARKTLHHGGFALDNGIVVHSDDWNSLVIASFPAGVDRNGNTDLFTCTASFVGPTALLTAAHCLVDPQTNSIRRAELGIEGWPRNLNMGCDVDPKYISAPKRNDIEVPKSSSDFALCHVDIPTPALGLLGVRRFETVDVRRVYPPRSPVLMTGYGCTNLHIETGSLAWDEADGELRVGDAQLAAVPQRGNDGNQYYSIVSQAHSAPALCPGDSGGPLIVGVTAQNPTPNRLVIGVNSMIETDGSGNSTSSIAALGAGEFAQFLNATYLAHHRGEIICVAGQLPVGERRCH